MNIIWKNIYLTDFSEKYLVSTTGEIKNIYTGKISNKHIRNGYYAVSLCNNKITKTMNIHSLVANTYYGYKQNMIINHKNGNKLDNTLDNLEHVTYKENSKHALDTKLLIPHTKAIQRYTQEDEFIDEYASIKEASIKLNVNAKHISAVCKLKRKTAGGFIWKYKQPFEILHDCNGKIIDNYPNYKVTKDGKIYSIRYKKIMEHKKSPCGYLSIKLCNNKLMKDYYIHRLVATAYIENPLNKKWVNHKDGNKSNNNVDNLEWVTHSENMIHAFNVLKH